MTQEVVKITMDLETGQSNIGVNVSGLNKDALVALVGSLEKVKSELLKGVPTNE